MNTPDPERIELLSAYLDGELDPRERQDLERRLTEDPQLAGELESLRGVSTLLQRWTVESPATPRWLRRFGQGRSRERLTARVLLAACAACFVAGIGLGLAAAPPGAPVVQPLTTPVPAATPAAIPPGQAHDALREVTASALRARLVEEARAGRWDEARALYGELTRSYSDTNAAREALSDPRIGRQLLLSSTLGRL